MYVQPINQYRCLLYGTASESHLGALLRQQNYLIRISLELKRIDEVRTYQKIFHSLDIRVSCIRLLKIFCTMICRDHHSLLVNNFISTSEIKKCPYDQNPKSLTTKCKVTTNKRGQKHEYVICSTQSLIWTDRFRAVL